MLFFYFCLERKLLIKVCIVCYIKYHKNFITLFRETCTNLKKSKFGEKTRLNETKVLKRIKFIYSFIHSLLLLLLFPVQKFRMAEHYFEISIIWFCKVSFFPLTDSIFSLVNFWIKSSPNAFSFITLNRFN